MKKRKLVSILLLLLMSFSMLHAFIISFLDEHHHDVTEYIQEFYQLSSHDEMGDVCDIHHEFHMVYLLPELTLLQAQVLLGSSLVIHPLSYQFQTVNDFLKPPIS